jgi:hypothetical protein
MRIPLKSNEANEWSYVSIDPPSDSMCHMCSKTNVGMIYTENSDGNNSWVGLCKECCDNLFKKIEEMTKKPV